MLVTTPYTLMIIMGPQGVPVCNHEYCTVLALALISLFTSNLIHILMYLVDLLILWTTHAYTVLIKAFKGTTHLAHHCVYTVLIKAFMGTTHLAHHSANTCQWCRLWTTHLAHHSANTCQWCRLWTTHLTHHSANACQ